MRSMTILTAVLIAGVAVQAASDAGISAAIAEGAKLKNKTDQIGFRKSGTHGGFHVMVMGPYGRIALASAQAAEKFLPFTEADVTDDMKSQTLAVWLEPHRPEFFGSAGWSITRPARNVVIRQKGSETVVQPKMIHREPRTFANAVGGKFESEAAGITFDLSALPAGDLELLIVGDQGTGTVTIKEKDRAKIR